MITSNFFSEQRLGNQLSILHALIGLSERKNVPYCIPSWKYAAYFEPVNIGQANGELVHEKEFHYTEYDLDFTKDLDFRAYFQSPLYYTRKLKFNPDYLASIKHNYRELFSKPTICVHIRRTDYVDNPNYYQLPVSYFYLALEQLGIEGKNILFFSDDIDYCKIHFECLDAHFIDASDIDSLCLMSLCDEYVLSNSSFSFWGAFLGNPKRVLHPAYHFDGELKKKDSKDFWVKEWETFDHVGKKLDLSDTTFIIPVSYDSGDRQHNLNLCVCLLQKYFDTNIIVGEVLTDKFKYMEKWCEYVKFDYKDFHRTKMLNEMTRMSKTEKVFNWDADVCISPYQIYQSVKKLDSFDVVYPYDGRFARVPRLKWFKKMEKYLDVGILQDKFSGLNEGDNFNSVGGAVGYNKTAFLSVGGENEKFISYAPEDTERFFRFSMMLKVARVNGILFHIDHWVGKNSWKNHGHYENSVKEWEKVKMMNKEQLQEYISTW